MIAETDLSTLPSYLTVFTQLGLGGLAWYLIAIVIPKLFDKSEASNIRLQEIADLRADKHLKETKEQLQLIMTSHEKALADIKEQLKFTVERHEATVTALISAQEKQIDRVFAHFQRTLNVS